MHTMSLVALFVIFEPSFFLLLTLEINVSPSGSRTACVHHAFSVCSGKEVLSQNEQISPFAQDNSRTATTAPLNSQMGPRLDDSSLRSPYTYVQFRYVPHIFRQVSTFPQSSDMNEIH